MQARAAQSERRPASGGGRAISSEGAGGLVEGGRAALWKRVEPWECEADGVVGERPAEEGRLADAAAASSCSPVRCTSGAS